jgi:membrane-associated phospholipid phosphatase
VSLAAGFAVLTALLAAGWLLDLDVAVRDWCDTHRPEALYWTARGLNFLGNGTPMAIVTLGLALLVARRVRSPRPLLVPIVTFGLTTVVVYALKWWLDRAAPRSPLPNAVELFSGGESYPSGHLVVAIVWYGAIARLLDRLVVLPDGLRNAIRVAPPVIVLGTTTYVSFHWLTDGLAAILLGLLLDRLLNRLPSVLPPPRSDE